MPKLKLTKPKAIHFTPTPLTEAVIADIRSRARIARGPFAAVATHYVAGLIDGGKLVFVEHQLQLK